MTTQTARDALLAELITGEDPASPEYADAKARVERLLDDHATEVREQVAAEIDAAVQRNLAEHPDEPAMFARRLGL
ncbi:hypothetical protein ACFC1T_27815, partial [Kitasatospora sp. NPDC056076]|uniref:hypothetical protein n=1 Tax=Kitasatospora sp. NPDC056076 TaxID=3345703 RepID=UPI0035E32252